MVPFYNAKDQAIYNAGDKFMSQSKYLLNDYVPTEGISYEGDGSPVSYANSMGGIMTQAPIIYPPINQGGGGGGGGGFTGPTGPGSYDSQFDPVTENKAFNEDIGVGTIAEEDDEEEGKIGKMGLAKIAGATLFGGPFSGAYTAYNERQKAKQKEIDKINAAIEAQYGPSDPGLRGNDDTPGFGITAAGNYTNQFEGGDPGLGGGTTGGFDTGGGKEMMARGGRAGYFFGGRVNYKQGGEIAGPGDTGGEGGEDPQDQSDSQFGGGGDNNNNNPPPTFYDNGIQVITNQSKLGFNYPTGLTKNLGIGQLTAILNAKKSLEEEEPAGFVQYDSSIGPVDTRATFDTTTGPELNASYTNNNFNANLNTKTGLSSGYSKKIGPGTLTLDGNLRPDGTYDTKAKYGIYFANGGLASIL